MTRAETLKLVAEINQMRKLLLLEQLKEEELNLVSYEELLVQKEELEKRISDSMALDDLTSLLRKSSIEKYLSEELMRSEFKGTTSILYLDLDNYKKFNDENGHLKGDKLLKMIAQDLKKNMHYGDFIGRWGGDEFLIILRDTDITGAIKAAQKIQNDFFDSKNYAKENFFDLTMSIGCVENNHDSVESIIDKADKAMYYAKTNGKNAIGVYDGEIPFYYIDEKLFWNKKALYSLILKKVNLWFDLTKIPGKNIANTFFLYNNSYELKINKDLFVSLNAGKAGLIQKLNEIRQIDKGTARLYATTYSH